MLVLSAHLEPQAEAGAVAELLAAELRVLADWLSLDAIAVERRGNLARPPPLDRSENQSTSLLRRVATPENKKNRGTG
jgi:hypothetical protein